MTPVRTIAIYATACGIVACLILSVVSSKMETAELAASLHHRDLQLHDGLVQVAIVVASVILTFVLDKEALVQLYRRGGRRRLFGGVAAALGFFALSFMIVAVMLPPHG